MMITLLAAAFTLVGTDRTARLVVDSGAEEAVVVAAEDLRADIRRVTGREVPLVRAARPRKGDVFISTRADGRWEAYDGTLSGGVLRLTGSDALGTVFAVYDFAERYLGVDPLYWWNDAPVPSAETLSWDRVDLHAGEPAFRYRGFFVNDEDLLCGWKEPAGHRRTDYKYYDNVIAPELMDRIVEAAVRCRMNLVIPASLTNIFNPPEAALLDVCARRGVYVSQHHIEPLGVSSFTFQRYWQDKDGSHPLFSYFSDPDALEEVWRASAERWARYPRVIWQVGLKGRGDRAIWHLDPGIPDSDSLRADVISRAMETQVRILDEVGVPRAGRVMTSTLWADAAVFNATGYLRFPAGTTVVFSDNSPGWQWTEDFWTTPRRPGGRYGVYYHPALMTSGPHLASLVPPGRTFRLLREARQMHADDYVVFNVANLREVCCNLDACSRMAWDIDTFDPSRWWQDYVARHFSREQEDWAAAYGLHYAAPQVHPESGMPLLFDGQMIRRAGLLLDRLEGLLRSGGLPEGTAPGPDDAWTRSLSSVNGLETLSRKETVAALRAQQAAFFRSMAAAQDLYARLSGPERPFAFTTLVYPTSLMAYLSGWMLELVEAEGCLVEGDRAGAAAHIAAAASLAGEVRPLAAAYCSGRWEGWYDDCCKLDLYGVLDATGSLLEGVQASAL